MLSTQGTTPFRHACRKGHEANNALLPAVFLKYGQDKLNVNLTYEPDKQTVLMEVSFVGHLNIVNQLLGAGAAVDATDQNSKTSLFYASQANHDQVISSLVTANANVNHQDGQGSTALMVACEAGHNESAAATLGTR